MKDPRDKYLWLLGLLAGVAVIAGCLMWAAIIFAAWKAVRPMFGA